MVTTDVFQGDRRRTLDMTVGAIVSLLSVAYAVATLQARFYWLAGFLCLATLVQLISTVGLRKRSQYSTHFRVVLLLSADFALFIFCHWAGSWTGFYHFYLSLTALPLLFVTPKNRWATRACVLVPSVLYIALEVSGSRLMLPRMSNAPALVEVLYWILLPCRFIFLLVGAHYLALSGQKAQARINLTLSELRESVRTSRALLSAIPDMIFRVSDEGRFLDFHCQAVNDLFLPPEKMIGKKLAEVLPPAIAARLYDRVIAAIMCGDMHLFSFELERAGVVHYYETRIASTGANDVLMVVQDVSERVRAEKTILEQQIRAASASKMASLGEMAAGIAHEINNPLAIISGNAQQLKDMVESGDFERSGMAELADKVDQTALRISKIIRSLRFFARDGQDDPFEEASACEIVADTLEFCRQRFLSHSIDLRVQEIPLSLILECRAVQIGQVLLNLLNNAHDAIESLPDRWIELAVEDLGAEIRISVMDSGSGISSNIRNRILEPFFTTKDVGKGTGLGLSISKGIMESHHGRIYVDNDSPHTKFVMELPKSQRPFTQQRALLPQPAEDR